MTIQTHPVFQTRFGMHVPCDIATYKQLKRIRHLASFAQVMARRWSRAQRRLPHNRTFRRGRVNRAVTHAMLFELFWQPDALTAQETPATARPTPLLEAFMQDYLAARVPKATAKDVSELKLSLEQVAGLLALLEQWQLDVFLKW